MDCLCYLMSVDHQAFPPSSIGSEELAYLIKCPASIQDAVVPICQSARRTPDRHALSVRLTAAKRAAAQLVRLNDLLPFERNASGS